MLTDQEIKNRYPYWRVRVFYSILVGYVFYYLTRKTISFAIPTMMIDLGLSKSDFGIVLTALSISYGVSKFVNGVIGDRSNPRYFMAIGLFMTALCNLCAGFSSSILFFTIFWILNGWFQGFGWPASARTLTHWFSRSERGRWWGLFSTSQNIGAAIVPYLAGFAIQMGGWRMAFYLPAFLCILAGIFVLNRLRDVPQSLGLPRIEDFRNEKDELAPESEERVFSAKEILFAHVLSNPIIWFLALANLFVYVVRAGIGDWSTTYLVQMGGYTSLEAAGPVSLFEIGGFLGMIGAGAASDKIFKGNRGLINVIMLMCILVPILIFSQVDHNNAYLDSALMFLMGLFLYGPQMLIGCAAAERAHKNAAATASGFAGTFAYVGAALAGYPLMVLTDAMGWSAFFATLLVACVLGALCFVPLVLVESRSKQVLKANG